MTISNASEQFRPRLFAIAYRMLGSAMEAEDAVQETFLRTQSATWESIQSPEAYLRAVLIRLCIDQLKSARAAREAYFGVWLPEPISMSADPAEQVGDLDTFSMAFLLVLESLSPEERAVFLLRQMFDYPYSEIASILKRSEASCRQLFSRARKRISAHPRPRLDTLPEHRATLDQFLQALRSGEFDQVVALLADDAVLQSDGGGKASAATHVLRGAPIIARFLIGLFKQAAIRTGYTFELKAINGRENLIVYEPTGEINTAMIVETHDGKVQNVYSIRNPDKLQHLT